MKTQQPVEILRDDAFIFDCYRHSEQPEYYVYVYDTNRPLPSHIGVYPDPECALTLRVFRVREKPSTETVRAFCQRFLDDIPFRITWIRRKQQEKEKLESLS